MFCQNCGHEIKDGTNFCGSCGQKISTEADPQSIKEKSANDDAEPAIFSNSTIQKKDSPGIQTKDDKKNQKKPMAFSILNWSLPPDQLAKQVSQYKTLKIQQSSRGVVVIVIAVFLLITVLLTAFAGIQSWTTTIIGMAIYCLLALFIYRGSRVAIILTMLIWTGDKITQIAQGAFSISILFWWVAVMAPLYAALQVENARRKRDTNSINDPIKS